MFIRAIQRKSQQNLHSIDDWDKNSAQNLKNWSLEFSIIKMQILNSNSPREQILAQVQSESS